MKPRVFALLYGVMCILHLLAELLIGTGNEVFMTMRFITKPALMILLFLYFLTETGLKRDSRQKMILTSLAFSWSGDVNLMMPGVEGFEMFEKQFFILGLISFLIAHVFYILAFRKDIQQSSAVGYLKRAPWAGLPVLAFLAILLYILIPGINTDMRIPVVVYAGVISIMTLFALNRFGAVSRQSFWLVFIGAVLFMVSDSMIAINKFHTPFEASRFAIMFTYLLAQYLIVKGSVSPHAGSRN